MHQDLLIGVDVGTQGTKAIVCTPQGDVRGEAFLPSRLIYGPDGSITQDPDEIYESVLTAIAQAASGCDASRVAAIGLDAQMAGILGIDDAFQAVTPYDSWLDTRCHAEIKRLRQTAEADIIRTTGCPVVCAHAPKMLHWQKHAPEQFRQASKFVVLSAYLCGRLAGLRADDAYLDYTQLHFSGFGNVQTLQWSEALLSEFAMPRAMLPEIIAPHRIIGALTDAAAARCGLVPGTPIAAGCGDQAAAALGAGITKPGQAFDSAGTASVFSCCTDQFRPDIQHKTLLYARSVLDGLWTPLAYITGGGLCLKWYAETIRHSTLRELDALAAELPPCEGLYFLPHFSGRTCPEDSSVRGGWLGLNLSHTDAHLYRAILESIGYEYSLYKDCLTAGGADIQTVLVTGGGAKSQIFSSIKADILGLPYLPATNCGSAAFGSAITAGFGVGLISDLAAAAENATTTGEPILPQPARTQQYQPLAKQYQQILERWNLQ